MNQQNGKKGKKAARIESNKSSKTFRATKALCEKYLCEEYKATLEAVKTNKMYVSCEKILQMIETQECFGGKNPADHKIVVRTEKQYKKYFRSEEGKNHMWQVVLEFPKLNKNRDDIKIECWFLESHQFISVEFLKFCAISRSFFEISTFAAFL